MRKLAYVRACGGLAVLTNDLPQMVVSMGAYRAGIPGGLLSFALWNIPSFIILTLAGLGVKELLDSDDPDWLSGLGPAAISLVFVAAYKVRTELEPALPGWGGDCMTVKVWYSSM